MNRMTQILSWGSAVLVGGVGGLRAQQAEMSFL